MTNVPATLTLPHTRLKPYPSLPVCCVRRVERSCQGPEPGSRRKLERTKETDVARLVAKWVEADVVGHSWIQPAIWLGTELFRRFQAARTFPMATRDR